MRNKLRNFVQDQKGGVAVEMGLTAVPFVLFIIAIIEISLLFFAWNSIQAGAADMAVYGQKPGDPSTLAGEWKLSGAVPFISWFQVTPTCYSDVTSFQNESPAPCDASSKVIRWTIQMDWNVITPMMAWVLPARYGLTAASVTRRS